jgi:hypothetical protein
MISVISMLCVCVCVCLTVFQFQLDVHQGNFSITNLFRYNHEVHNVQQCCYFVVVSKQ